MYKHTREVHNLTTPEVLVPVIYDVIKPKSLVDIGGGIGNFAYVFERLGLNDLNIIDGSWVNKDLLYVDKDKFITCDLTKPLNIDREYDLSFCLEVAEHIEERYTDTLVKNIVSLSDLIVFSAAIPNQGGQNHVNEQYIDYWIDKFEKHNYHFHDVLRPLFWDNEKIKYWYKNIFLISKVKSNRVNLDDIINKFKVRTKNKIFSYIHPELLEYKSKFFRRYKILKKVIISVFFISIFILFIVYMLLIIYDFPDIW